MKKYVVLFFLSVSQIFMSQDLITDGGFEDNPLNAAWTKTGAALATVTTDALFGSRRANFGNEAITVRQNITAVSAVVYRVSFYWRFSNAASTTDAFASIRLQSDNSVIKTITLPKSTGDWTFSSFTFSVTGAGADLDLYVQFHKFARNSVMPTSENNAMRFDNVSIVPVVIAPNGDDLITNGTLETEDLTGFTAISGGISVNSGSSYAGTHSLNMGNDFQNFKQDFTAVAGVKYQLSYFAKYNNAGVNAGGEATTSIRLTDGLSIPAVVVGSNKMSVATTDWTYFSFKFIAAQTNLTFYVAKNNRSGGGTNNSARFDNISIKPIYEWNGCIDTDWSTAANWDLQSLPLTGASVLVSNVANAPTISSTTGVNVYDIAINEPGEGLIINGGGSLVVDGTASGNLTYKRTLGAREWSFFGSPVVGETYDDAWATENDILSLAGTNRAIITYSPVLEDWVYSTTGTSGTFDSSTGYGIARTTAGVVSFTGTYPTGAKPAIVSNANVDNKFNLVSNPFPTYYRVSEFFTDNASVKFTEDTIWIWNQTADDYVPKTKGVDGSFEIAPGQGFFISSGNGTQIEFFQFRGSSASDTFLRSDRTSIQLSVQQNNKVKTTDLYYSENGTKDFDNGFDASSFGANEFDFSLYSNLLTGSEKALARQVLPLNEMENTVVPIGINAKADITLTFSAENQNLPNGMLVYLEDRINNTFTQLNAAENVFKLTPKQDLEGAGRFYLHTKNSVLNTTDAILLAGVKITVANHKLKVIGLPEGKVSIKMYNLVGKQFLNKSFNNEEISKEISLERFAKGMYIISLQTKNGRLSKKIIIE